MDWFSLLGTALRVASDLHIDANNDPQSFVAQLSAWSYTEDGQKTLGDLNQLFEELGLSLRVAVAHKP